MQMLKFNIKEENSQGQDSQGQVDKWEKHNRGKMSLADKEIKAKMIEIKETEAIKEISKKT